MLFNLLVGIPVMLLCLLMEALILVAGMHYYLHRLRSLGRHRLAAEILLLAALMLAITIGYLLQIAIWAALFWGLGEFDEFATALYFSGATFTTLGYGDLLLSERWRLLGVLEGGNGVLMLGMSTAAMTAAVKEVLLLNRHRPARSD